MKEYMICLNGCDDSTCFEMKLNEAQLEFLEEVSEKSKETSTYGCMPTLLIEEVE